MEEAQLLRLPWELILNVMTCYLPSNPTALVPASDDATQLLLSFCLVNRGSCDFAVRRIQQHCVVLDSEDRLRRFLLCLEASRDSGLSLPSVFNNIHTIYLAPFGSIMDNLPTASWVRNLFGYASETLKRLIVDMPFESLPPWHDHLNVGRVLLEGFEMLVNLEEFVCTRNAASLPIYVDGMGHKSILYRWPNIKRLALNRPVCDMGFWECVADMPRLKHAVFSGTLWMTRDGFDFEELYVRRAGPGSTMTILLGDVRDYKAASSRSSIEPSSDDERDHRVQLMAYKIPLPGRKKFFDTNTEWLMGTAIAGELWDIKGDPIVVTAAPLTVPHPDIAELE